MIDLRSDTFTVPGKAMRKAISSADLGDDVYREDPTVNRLEDMSAELTQKEAALFVPSGSMGNLIPLYICGGRGNEVITHVNSHIVHYELASISAIAGVMPVTVEAESGILQPEHIEPKIRENDYTMAQTTMVEIENSHNLEGGTVYSLEALRKLYRFTQSKSLYLHMDGARIFNAAVATDTAVADICAHTDTITFCLSKGLGAPVGSLLCGPKDFIDKARSVRKMLGAGMRQAGVLAAAGIYALENNIDRLACDHEHAKQLAQCLSSLSGVTVAPEKVITNILYFDTRHMPAVDFCELLREKGVLAAPSAVNTVRFVTSMLVDSEDIKTVCRVLKEL